MLLIPAIDLRGGACVRLYQGDFNAETHYSSDPLEIAARYRALGASWLHVVDLDGAREGAPGNHAAILALAARSGLKLQVGGGIRTRSAVDALFAAGVQRVVLGSLAVENHAMVSAWVRAEPERICLALDVRIDGGATPIVQSRGWTASSSLSLWRLVETYGDSGLRHVLCTDVARDGALAGPNLELYTRAVQRAPQVAWQASGGVRSAADLAALRAAGAAAAISGKALLEQRITPQELQPFLPNASSPASTSATARS